MAKIIQRFFGSVFLIIGVASIIYGLNVANNLYRYTHNDRYSGEFTVEECRAKYATLYEAANNCPNVDGSYFLIRLISSTAIALIFIVPALHLVLPSDSEDEG